MARSDGQGPGETAVLPGTDDLVATTYDRLRSVAERHLRSCRSDYTLQATALVHEAYLRLARRGAVAWQDRAHFLATAATAIRYVLADHARRRRRLKRGGGWARCPLEWLESDDGDRDDDRLLALDEALASLGRVDPEKARLVELKFFAGLTTDEVARALQVSPSTVARSWRVARAWLRSELDADGEPDIGH